MPKREALTQQDLNDMKKMTCAGMGTNDIARIMKCHPNTVSKAKQCGFLLEEYKEFRKANNGSKKLEEVKEDKPESNQDDSVLLQKIIVLLERLIEILK